MVWSFFGFEVPTATSPAPKHNVGEEDDVGNDKTVEEPFECDYERDCTPLYRALENAMEPSEFEPIVKFLGTGYWPGSFFPDSISPEDQTKTWVTRFDPIDEKKVKWSQLPLHLAIVCGAPPSIIGRLVKLYPQALRCTDDQHMLPLHLALRQGANDDVLTYILMQFPDAVNAKGKNGRTAIDCALRAKDKLRGKILEIFVTKTRGRKSVKEVKELKADLAVKTEAVNRATTELEAMSASFESMKALKNSIEMDLLMKIQELESGKAEQEAEFADRIERLQSEKLLESLELQKKREQLEENYIEISASEKMLREEETALRMELDAIQERVAMSTNARDWPHLKKEVETLQAYRLKTSRSQTEQRMRDLKNELDKVRKHRIVDFGTHKEFAVIEQNVEKLDKHDVSSKSAEELNALRGEIDNLRAELKERTEATRTRVELSVLKKAMEMELKDAEGKTKEEIAALRKAIETTKMSELETKTSAELAVMKNQLETLKKELKNRELINKTKQDLEGVVQAADSAVTGSVDEATKSQFISMKENAERLEAKLMECKSNDDEIIIVKKDAEKLRDEMKKREITAKIIDEVTHLKTSVDAELKKSEGKTQQELLDMKKTVKILTEKELAKKDMEELAKVRVELSEVRENLKQVEKATQTKQELEALKKSLETEIKSTSSKTEETLAMMKKAVDTVDMEQQQSKTLKKSLADEIKQANTKTEKELMALKKSLDALDVKKLESTNKEEWDRIRKEMEGMKAELKATQENMFAEEVKSIKTQLDSLNLDKIRDNTDSQLQGLRNEMDNIRANLAEKNEDEAAMKKEIETLKKKDEIHAKKKKGLKKFFTRHFSRKGMASGDFSVAGEVTNGKEDQPVPTIAPPSMQELVEAMDLLDSDEDSKASHLDLLTKLSLDFEGLGSVAEEKKEEYISSQATAPIRKVQSMDARINSPKAAGRLPPAYPKGIPEIETVETKEDAIERPVVAAN